MTNTSCTVPCVIGKNGIEEIKIIDISEDEKMRLKKSYETVSPYMRTVEEFLKNSKK
jgi:malate/lactate dehydrogenase